ncbi:MAG: hypothetical protein QNJ68_02870 [Microcoleaceae cyanobacterium MO_207.B10]|nr:hypothetical protein [Microcoleaceae cyanobacterium MO_207.B10]
MVGATKRIEEELKKIKEAIADIAKELYETYQGYLEALGQAMRQQLILASYNICTEAYPEAFLNLSFDRRQKMQEELRETAKVADKELQELLQKDPDERGEEINETSAAELMMSLLSEGNYEQKEATLNLNEEGIEFDSSILFPAQETFSESQPEEQKVEDKKENFEPNTENQKEENNRKNIIDKLDNIDNLIYWQESIEKKIPEALRNLSHQTNCILKKTEILPKKLPEKVLAAATKMEAGDTPIGGPPNILNLLVEADNSEKEKESKITKITAVNLRLSEIEFADANVTVWRNKIRKLLGKLSQLQREYRKKQRELSVIEAQSAWRSSWYEEK